MNYPALSQAIFEKCSYLCVGLDTDPDRIPTHLRTEKDPVYTFNKAIIEATAPYGVAYKINTAFYEARGGEGWECMQKTLEYLPRDTFRIADAKRGDIGNTVLQYARAFFEQMDFDAITVSPYMGEDSVKPFLQFPDKWVILLALTSNQSSRDFQLQKLNPEKNGVYSLDQTLPDEDGGEYLFERVMKTSQYWASKSRLMYVVGATQTQYLKKVRTLAPDHFLLLPGVGAQGGDLEAISKIALNKQGGLLVNVSRAISYASDGKDFALKAGQKAKELQEEMARYLDAYTLLKE